MIRRRFDCSDRAQFLANRRPGTRIRVVRMPTTELVCSEGRVDRVGAVDLTYSFVKDGERWLYHELRLGDRDGLVNLADTLWAQLERDGDYVLVQRSGSF